MRCSEYSALQKVTKFRKESQYVCGIYFPTALFVKELFETVSTIAVTILKTLQCCDVMTKKRYF